MKARDSPQDGLYASQACQATMLAGQEHRRAGVWEPASRLTGAARETEKPGTCGKPRTYGSPVAVFDKLACYFRLKYDPVSCGKCHACAYCYRIPLRKIAKRSIQGIYANPSYADPEYLPKLLKRALVNGAPGKIPELLRKRTPVRLGSMSDPLDPDRRVRATTIVALKTLVQHEYPFLLYTKSDYVASPEILDLLKQAGRNALVHVSLSNLDRWKEQKLEPLAPSCFQRLEAIRRLLRAGVPVVLRIAPIILGVNDDSVKPLMKVFAAMGGRKVIIEQLRVGSDFKSFLEQHFQQALDQLPKRYVRNYIRYEQDTCSPTSQEVPGRIRN